MDSFDSLILPFYFLISEASALQQGSPVVAVAVVTTRLPCRRCGSCYSKALLSSLWQLLQQGFPVVAVAVVTARLSCRRCGSCYALHFMTLITNSLQPLLFYDSKISFPSPFYYPTLVKWGVWLEEIFMYVLQPASVVNVGEDMERYKCWR